MTSIRRCFHVLCLLGIDLEMNTISGVIIDNNHAHPNKSMKLGRNVHKHELLEFFSLANQNWSIFKMAALKSKIAAAINVKS